MLNRIYNDILQEPRTYFRGGFVMCQLATLFMLVGLFITPHLNDLLSHFDGKAKLFDGLPWPLHFLFPQTPLAAIPWAIVFAAGAWLAYTAHHLKKYL